MSIESDLAAAMQMRKAVDRIMRDVLERASASHMSDPEIAAALGIGRLDMLILSSAVRHARDDEPIELRPDHA